jgi:ribose 5-phosphate isomerase B
MMRIAVAADHAGLDLKTQVAASLRALGYDVADLGAHEPDPADDYPDFSERLGRAVAAGHADRGILICGSGVGASIAANKIPGVRAGLCHDCYSAHQGVEHDDMNILVLGGRVIGPEPAKELARIFAEATFSGGERHLRRLQKVLALEQEFARSDSSPAPVRGRRAP